MPTISYMTLVDKYQVMSLVYLVMCCIWHASLSNLNIGSDAKIIADKIALGVFAFMYLLMQVLTSISIFVSYKKLDKFKKIDREFADTISGELSDDD